MKLFLWLMATETAHSTSNRIENQETKTHDGVLLYSSVKFCSYIYWCTTQYQSQHKKSNIEWRMVNLIKKNEIIFFFRKKNQPTVSEV